MVVIAGYNHRQRAGRVRVRSADQHVLFWYAAFLLNISSHVLHELPRHGKRIDADQRHAILTVVEYGHADLAGVVDAVDKALAVAARPLHADCRRDVGFGQTDLEQGRRRLGFGDEQECNRKGYRNGYFFRNGSNLEYQ